MLTIFLNGCVTPFIDEIVELIKFLLDSIFLTSIPLGQVLQVLLLILQFEDLSAHISHFSIVLRL